MRMGESKSRKRHNSQSTEFGLWLRDLSSPLSSYDGYRNTNIDYFYFNVNKKKFCFIEEKRYDYNDRNNTNLRPYQVYGFQLLDQLIRNGTNSSLLLDEAFQYEYIGYYVIIFEYNTPVNGRIYLNTLDEHYEGLKMDIDESGLRLFLDFDEKWKLHRNIRNTCRDPQYMLDILNFQLSSLKKEIHDTELKILHYQDELKKS